LARPQTRLFYAAWLSTCDKTAVWLTTRLSFEILTPRPVPLPCVSQAPDSAGRAVRPLRPRTHTRTHPSSNTVKPVRHVHRQKRAVRPLAHLAMLRQGSSNGTEGGGSEDHYHTPHTHTRWQRARAHTQTIWKPRDKNKARRAVGENSSAAAGQP
jgi:hypothetical protein